MRKIIAVSAGQMLYKKDNSILTKRIKYLNYGLLGLVTILNENLSIDITMFQADDLLPTELFEEIITSGININDCECLLLSIPSFYSISWCKEFCALIKDNYHVKIIAGGRWVVDGNKIWLNKKIGNIDEYIEGFGEQKLYRLLGGNDSIVKDGATHCFKKLDYTLLYKYQQYQPSIEISRGCGAGCYFCADKNNQRLPNKSVNDIIIELDDLDNLYQKYSVYFEAPHFVFEKEWTKELCHKLCNRNNNTTWRCTSRVESIPLDKLKELSESGLKVIDIGLESASIEQLYKMGKSKYPEKYIKRTERILEVCSKFNIWVKLNILLYAGETYKTIGETEKWLTKNKDLIKDISVSSLVYYKNSEDISKFIKQGATIPNDQSLEDQGYVNLNLSNEISYLTAKKYTKSLPKIVANMRDYYDIKSISYFSPNYTFEDFKSDIINCEDAELPFRKNR